MRFHLRRVACLGRYNSSAAETRRQLQQWLPNFLDVLELSKKDGRWGNEQSLA
jgi:hypothetical protein